MEQSRGMYEPMAVLRSLAELQHKFQPDPCSNSIDFASPTSAAANYEEALSKAMEDGDYKNTPAFLAEENQVKVIEYKGENVASFMISNIEMICLPQNMVGGLHTVYTKLKRLEISPLVCNVEQVRALRSLGAIQPGVNRCKLIAKTDFDLLYDDCTSSCNRPGRPTKRVTDDWLTAQQSITVPKQSKVEVGSPPIVVSQSGPFSAESLLNSTAPSNILGSSLLSGMNSLNGSQSALLSLLPGFNHILMQQVIAQQAKLRETRERECENEDDDRRDDGDQSREEEEKDESNSCTDDSPMSNKKREQKSQTRSRDDSSSREDSKSLSPNNNSGSSPSGRFSQNQMNSQDFSKLISLLESTVEHFKKREDASEEKDRRERAERQLAIERKRSNLYIIRWNRTRREMASLRERIKILEESSKDV